MESTATLRIPLDDLACGEARILESELAVLPGVLRVYVNPVTDVAYLEYDEAKTSRALLRRAIEFAGFTAGQPEE